MILQQELVPIGHIHKPHGIHGEMSFHFTVDVFDREELPFLILEMEGIPVPFSVAEYRLKSAMTGMLRFEGIDSEEAARIFSGLPVYVQQQHLDLSGDSEVSPDYFVGFEVHDVHQGLVGIIRAIDRSTENVLFVIELAGDEWLMPASEDYMRAIDHEGKTLQVVLPEGLLELN